MLAGGPVTAASSQNGALSVSFQSGPGVAAGAAEGTAASAQPAEAAAPSRPRRRGVLRPQKPAEGGTAHAFMIPRSDNGTRVNLGAQDFVPGNRVDFLFGSVHCFRV